MQQPLTSCVIRVKAPMQQSWARNFRHSAIPPLLKKPRRGAFSARRPSGDRGRGAFWRPWDAKTTAEESLRNQGYHTQRKKQALQTSPGSGRSQKNCIERMTHEPTTR